MPHALPTDTNRQPAPIRAMFERCARLRLPAIVLGPGGSVVASTGVKPGHALTLVPSAGVLPTRVHDPVDVEPAPMWPGVAFPVRSLHSDPWWCVAFQPLSGAAGEIEAGFPTWTPEAGQAVRNTLRLSFADLTELEEHRAALNSFTVQLSESYDTIDLLYGIGRSMRVPAQPSEFVEFVCNRLQTTLNFSWIAAVFPGEKWVVDGLRAHTAAAGQLPSPEAMFRAAVLPYLGAESLGPSVIDAGPELGGGQVVAQPIICKGLPIGVLIAGGKGGSDPMVSSYDTQLIEAAAGYLSAFAENVALYDDQHQLFMGTVQAITAAIDAKDHYTRGHSERVAHLSAELGLAMGLTAPEAERLRIAGLVHDVGKIGVPEAVLTKPGRLTDAEFEQIKRHPEIGFRILRDIALLEDVIPAVMHHHERYDGKGYPHGLSGEAIPLYARILAVADTFDAMSSNRAYRNALPREKVLGEMTRCAGTQFDPIVAPLMLRIDLGEYDRLVARHAADAQGSTAVAA